MFFKRQAGRNIYLSGWETCCSKSISPNSDYTTSRSYKLVTEEKWNRAVSRLVTGLVISGPIGKLTFSMGFFQGIGHMSCNLDSKLTSETLLDLLVVISCCESKTFVAVFISWSGEKWVKFGFSIYIRIPLSIPRFCIYPWYYSYPHGIYACGCLGVTEMINI